jgi:hypothetical protein
MKNLLLGLAALTLVGCGPTFAYRSAGVERPAKPPTCNFAVLTAPPAEPHQKLGTFTIQYDNTGFIDKPEQLKRRIQADVCKVGGDAIEGHANRYGTYTKVTVYALQTAVPEAAPSEAEAGADEEASSSDSVPEI